MAVSHPDYTIVRELGRGGSAAVYLAVQKSLNRRVALKVLHGYAADQGERFLREGRIVARLNHPAIVPVYDVGRIPDSDSYFMSMEYLEGGSLRDRLPEFTLADLFRTLDQICTALTCAHDQGFVHRDVKPDNILFRTLEEALLADFGIARQTDSLTQMTVTGAMLGTPDYMSPEQVAGEAIDARADLYSLGVVLFEALAGFRPFQGDNVLSTGLQHLTVQPEPLPKNVQRFQPLLNRLLAKKPADRVASAEALRLELARLRDTWSADLDSPLETLHTGAEPQRASIAATLKKHRRRNPAVLALTGVVMLALAGSVGFLVMQPEPTPIVLEPEPPSELELTLAAADEAFALDRWFGEEEALAMYRAALVLEPANAHAEARIESMLDTALDRAEARIADRDLDAAAALLATLRGAWPEEARVGLVLEQLGAAREAAQTAAARQRRIQRVDRLITEAQAAVAAGQLTGESGAAGIFRQVLTMDADNSLARAGLTNILDTLVVNATNAISTNAFDVADAYLEQIAAIDAGHNGLAGLQDRNARARQAFLDMQDEAAARAELSNRIDALALRVDAWVGDDEAALDAVYEALTADLEQLLAQTPREREVQRLLDATRRHAEQLEAAELNRESAEDDDQFRIISF